MNQIPQRGNLPWFVAAIQIAGAVGGRCDLGGVEGGSPSISRSVFRWSGAGCPQHQSGRVLESPPGSPLEASLARMRGGRPTGAEDGDVRDGRWGRSQSPVG